MNSSENSIKWMSADDAARLVKSGDRIYVQGSTSVPDTLLRAIAARSGELRGVTFYTGFSVSKGPAPICREGMEESFFVDSFFVSNNVRQWIADGNGSVTPRFLGDVPDLFRRGYWPLDVVLLNCSLPDSHGYVSFGVGGDVACSAVECGRTIIAQINPNMPFSNGDPIVHVSRLAAAVRVDDPLVEVPTPSPSEAERRIGRFIAQEIPDGATLQIGVGGIPNAVIAALRDHRDLGLHTEAMTDGVLPLLSEGIINNSRKKILPGKSVASLALGSRKLYDYMDHNPQIIFRDVAWTNNPAVIGANPAVMSINSCLEIDLTGQICADSIGDRIFSGVGGQHDFVTGANISEGGKSFIAMLATSSKGHNKIKAHLTPGAGVVTTRFAAEYIVTEYGIANLRGKNLIQRAKALIGLAAPQFREELDREARQRFGRAYSAQY